MASHKFRCGGCAFFALLCDVDRWGECRLKGPQPGEFSKVVKEVLGKWPCVEEDDWCGEFVSVEDQPGYRDEAKDR